MNQNTFNIQYGGNSLFNSHYMGIAFFNILVIRVIYNLHIMIKEFGQEIDILRIIILFAFTHYNMMIQKLYNL